MSNVTCSIKIICWVITWTNTDLISIEPVGKDFVKIQTKIQNIPFTKCISKFRTQNIAHFIQAHLLKLYCPKKCIYICTIRVSSLLKCIYWCANPEYRKSQWWNAVIWQQNKKHCENNKIWFYVMPLFVGYIIPMYFSISVFVCCKWLDCGLLQTEPKLVLYFI